MSRRVLLALCLVLPACGPDQAGPPPANDVRPSAPAPASRFPAVNAPRVTDAEERLRAATAATVAAGTARTSYLATLSDLPGRRGPVSLKGSGAVDFVAARMRTRLDLSQALEDPGSPDVDPSWETVAVDGVVYLRSPMLSDLFGAETPWLMIDPASGILDAAGGVSPLAQLAGAEGGGPLALLAGLVEGSVVDLGTGEVDGTTTTHLQAQIDVVAAVDHAGGANESDSPGLARFVDGLGARRLGVDAFLDNQGRVRRLVYEHQLPAEGGGGSQRVELGYSDFGQPVTIPVPPPEEVSRFDQLFAGG